MCVRMYIFKYARLWWDEVDRVELKNVYFRFDDMVLVTFVNRGA